MSPSSTSSLPPDAEDGEIVESALGSITEERFSPPLSHNDDGEIIEAVDVQNPTSSRSVRNRPPTPIRLPRPSPPASDSGPPTPEWSVAPIHPPSASRPHSSGTSGFPLRSDAQPFYPSHPPTWREWYHATSSSPPPPPAISAQGNHGDIGRPSMSFEGRSPFLYPSNSAEIRAQQQRLYYSQPQFRQRQGPSTDKRPYSPQIPYAHNNPGPSHGESFPTREGRDSSRMNVSSSVGQGGCRSDKTDNRNAQDFRIQEQYQGRRDYVSREEYLPHGFYRVNPQNSFVSREASVERSYSPRPNDESPFPHEGSESPNENSDGDVGSGRTQNKAEFVNDVDVGEEDCARRAEEDALAKEAEEQEAARRLTVETRAKELEKRKKKLRLQALRSMARVKKGRPGSSGGSAAPTPSPSVDDSVFPPLPGQGSGLVAPPVSKRHPKHKSATASYASCVRDSGFPPLSSTKPAEQKQLPSVVSPSVAQALGTIQKPLGHHPVQPLPAVPAPDAEAVSSASALRSGTVPRPPSLQLPSSQTQQFVTDSRTSYRRAPPFYSQALTPMSALTPATSFSAVQQQQLSFAVHCSPNKDSLKFVVSSSEESSGSESDIDSEKKPRGQRNERHVQDEMGEATAEQKEDLEYEAIVRRKQIEAKQRALEAEKERLRREMTKLEEKKKREQKKKTSPGCSVSILPSPPGNSRPPSSSPPISLSLQNGLKRDFGTLEIGSGRRQENITSATKSPSADSKPEASKPIKRHKVGNTSVSPGTNNQTPLHAKAQWSSSSSTSPESSLDGTGTSMPVSGNGSPVGQTEIQNRKMNVCTEARNIVSPWNKVSVQPRGEPEKMNAVSRRESELEVRVESLRCELRSLSRDFVQQKEYVRLLVKAERSHAQCVERARKSRLRVAALRCELEAARGAHAKDVEDRRKSHRSLAAVHELGPQFGLPLSSLSTEAMSLVEDDTESTPVPTRPVFVSPSNSVPSAPPRVSNSTSLVLSDCALNAAGEAVPANRTEDLILMPSPFSPVPFDGPYRSVAAIVRAYKLVSAVRRDAILDGGGILSVTWRNMMDPMKIVCRFELQGGCKNVACPDKHLQLAATDKVHALGAIDHLVPLFGSIEGTVLKRAMLDAKLKIHDNKDPEKTLRALVRTLCESATIEDSGKIMETLQPSLLEIAAKRDGSG